MGLLRLGPLRPVSVCQVSAWEVRGFYSETNPQQRQGQGLEARERPYAYISTKKAGSDSRFRPGFPCLFP